MIFIEITATLILSPDVEKDVFQMVSHKHCRVKFVAGRFKKWTHQDVGVVLVLLPVQVAACREKERGTNSQRVTR